jgi:hypothetical protein
LAEAGVVAAVEAAAEAVVARAIRTDARAKVRRGEPENARREGSRRWPFRRESPRSRFAASFR